MLRPARPTSPALTDFDEHELAERFVQWGGKPSHAQKLLHAFYLAGGEVNFSRMKLGRIIESRLGRDILLRQSRILARSISRDGTVKLLVGMDRGGAAEAVLMSSHDPVRRAGCISSQIGCAMGCDFCASTKGGLERNLEAGEIVEQFLHLRREAADQGKRLATLVFMGMGEPMHNLDNVIRAIRLIASPSLGEFGGRQITVSTVGIVPGIQRLADADLNVHLALSLHAPDDQTRSRIVPMNRRYNVEQIIAAAKRYQERTGRIVNIEYCLLAGVNDSDEQAHALAVLLGGFRAHVNLIPYNAIGAGLSGVVYGSPSPDRAKAFLSILIESGAVAHLRHPRGNDVNAACGQLRRAVLG